jgi:hypothetical protein
MYVKSAKLINNLFRPLLETMATLNMSLIIFLGGWFLEWVFVIEYALNFWSYTRVIYPHRIPTLLMLTLFYWLFIWGVSVWRRALHGRFTRGDRKLWFKSYASFWFVEILTLVGIFIAACWMSWGPLPLMPRYFTMQKKSFIFELTLFTYIVWLTYLMRMSLKWQLYKTQVIITLIIILLISCLLWRDLATLSTREVVDVTVGAKWRHIRINSIIYSMSNIWWTEYFIGNKKTANSLFLPMSDVIESNFKLNPFSKVNRGEYEKYHWLPLVYREAFYSYAYPIIKYKDVQKHLFIVLLDFENNIEYMRTDITLDSYKFYPRKIGFYPKKLAMWYFLVVLRMWHHLMLFLWWFFYLIRLNTKHKSSYTLLSICYFNVYCCFLILLIVYSFHLLPVWENFLRIKPFTIRPKAQNWSKFNEGIDYCLNIFTLENSTKGSRSLTYQLYYDNILNTLKTNFYNFFQINKIKSIEESVAVKEIKPFDPFFYTFF